MSGKNYAAWKRKLGGASVAPFTPAAISGLTVWLKADAITGKSDGDAMSSWTDSSGNGNHAVQATGANQPLYKTGIVNGKPAVLFDDTNDKMVVAGLPVGVPLSVFVVYRNIGGAFTDRRAVSDNGAGSWLIGPHGGLHRAYVVGFLNGIAIDNALFVIAAVVQTGSGSTSFFANGAAGGTNTSDQPLTTLALSDAGAPLNGYIAEVIYYSAALSAGQRAQVTNYLATKYAITAS